MDKSFVERFDLAPTHIDAQLRFVNRMRNELYAGFVNKLPGDESWEIARAVATKLGVQHKGDVASMIGTDFLENLATVEAIYDASSRPSRVSSIVLRVLGMAERDLGVAWRDGQFYPTGARLLDEQLVNDPLKWLREAKHATVTEPFEKGLRHLLEAPQRPELTADVITDMYEAVEALAKIITGRLDKDLSANRELFLAAVKASDAYKKIMREYIDYANNFRHAMKQTPKPHVSLREAESFTYLTGLFIRLALPT